MNPAIWDAAENETPLNVDELQGLKPSLSTRAQLNELEQENIIEARAWAMRPPVLRRTDLLTDHFTRELHRRMFYGVWKWAGQYRTSDKNIGWEWPRIAEGMRVLMDDARGWLEYKSYPLTEAAVRMHHRMVAIHPWPNGNGRHSRLMADLMVEANGGKSLTWGANRDLSQPSRIRNDYITALKAADGGDFAAILEFAVS